MITYGDFEKLRIRIGLIVEAEKLEGADKLLKLKVDFGDGTIVDNYKSFSKIQHKFKTSGIHVTGQNPSERHYKSLLFHPVIFFLQC